MSKTMIIEKTNALLAGHCAEELRTAAMAWLAAVDTEAEIPATEEFILQLEDGIMPIDEVIAFFGTDIAAEKFGAEIATGIKNHAVEVKEKGGEWCDCPACTLAKEILGLFDDEDESGKMILEFEDGETAECDIICLFEVGDQTCIVLYNKEDDEVLFYGYKEAEDSFELYDLNDDEFEAAARAFEELMEE